MDGFEFARMAWAQTWQLAVLAVTVAALVRLVGRGRPHLAHVLWLVVLVKCVTPPIWSSRSGVFCWVGAALGKSATRSISEPVGKGLLEFQPARDFPVSRELPISAPKSVPRPLGAAMAVEPNHGAHLVVPVVAPPASANPWQIWLIAVWMAGSALMLSLSALRCWACLREIRAAGVAIRDDLEFLIENMSRRLRLWRRPRLLITESNVGPAVIGIWRPTIVMPAVVVRDKSAGDLEPILAHEMLHVRRGDLWIGMLQIIAQSLWWFHPMVWLTNRLIAREAERCCDEEVVGELRCDPARYARNLLDVLELKRTLQPLPAFPGVRPVEVTSQRLERIMKLGQGCRTRTPWWCWIVLLLVAALTLPGGALISAKEKRFRKKNGQLSTAPRLPVPRDPVVLPDNSLMIQMTVLSGSPQEIDSLHATNWNVLPAQIPPGQTLAEFQAKTAHVAAMPVVAASYHASVSERIEKHTPAMCAVLKDGDAAALQIRIRDRKEKLMIESRPQIVVLDGESSFVQVGAERPFVVGIKQDVQGGAQPQVRVVTEGWMMQIRPALKSNDEVRLDCQIEHSEVRDVEVQEIRASDQSTYKIQIPEVATTRLSLAHDVRLGHDLLIRGIQKTGKHNRPESTMIILRCSRVTSGTLPPVEAGEGSKVPDATQPSILPNPGYSRTNMWIPARAPLDLKKPEPYFNTPATSKTESAPWALLPPARAVPAALKSDGGVIGRVLNDERRAIEQQLYEKLNQPVKIDFDQEPLKDVLDDIAHQVGLECVIDESGIHEEDATLRTPLTLKLTSPIMARNALRLILDPLNLRFELRSRRITVTDAQMRISKSYYVADLVVPVPRVGEMRWNRDTQDFVAKAQNPPTAVLADFDTLINLIENTIQPDSWVDAGGTGAIESFPTNLSLVVSQTNRVHDQIADLLQQLRRLQDVQVSLETRILGVSNAAFERLGIDLDADNGENGGTAGKGNYHHLSSQQAAMLMEAVEQDRSAVHTNYPKITLFNGQCLSIPFDADNSARKLHLQPVVASDRRSVQLGHRLGQWETTQQLEPVTFPEGDVLLIDATHVLTPESLGWTGEYSVPVLEGIPYVSRLFKTVSPRRIERVFVLITPHVIIAEEQEVE